jgi:hypothetical protein
VTITPDLEAQILRYYHVECPSGKILNPLNQLWFKSSGLIRGGHDVDAGEPQTL